MKSEPRAEETQGLFFLLGVLQFIFSICPESEWTPTCTQITNIHETVHSEIAETYPLYLGTQLLDLKIQWFSCCVFLMGLGKTTTRFLFGFCERLRHSNPPHV